MKGAALREARISENASAAINKVEKKWDKFTGDFKYSTFMPPEEQRKLWEIYLKKDGEIDPKKDISFTISSPTRNTEVLSYGEIVKEAARNEVTVSSYLSQSYANPNLTISLNPLLDITFK